MIDPAQHALFRAICERTREFVLTTHVKPDGDALGSQVGLGRCLLDRGKSVRIVNHDPAPETLRFIEDPSLPVEVYDPARHDPLLASAERIVLLDNSAPDRLGRMEDAIVRAAPRTLCIDHHPTRDTPWADQIVDERACAASVMIYDLVRAWGWTPDVRAAEAIYVGLATDTGFFRFNSTNRHAHEVASELLDLGVEPGRAYREVYERNTLAFTRLLGHALAGLRLDAGGAVATVRLDREAIDRLEAHDVDTSEITTAQLALDGVSVALLFRELEDGRIKVSLRSKGTVDVHRLAGEFGGGGHRNASGIVMAGPLDDAVRTVTSRVEDALAQARYRP
jgi:phosphoesterase RecJ-like protein